MCMLLGWDRECMAQVTDVAVVLCSWARKVII